MVSNAEKISISWRHHVKSGNGLVIPKRKGCHFDEIINIGCNRSCQSLLQWRHNGRDNVSNHHPHDCLLNRLFRRRSKKTSKLRVTDLCVGSSPGPVNSPHKGPVTRKTFPIDYVVMHFCYWVQVWVIWVIRVHYPIHSASLDLGTTQRARPAANLANRRAWFSEMLYITCQIMSPCCFYMTKSGPIWWQKHWFTTITQEQSVLLTPSILQSYCSKYHDSQQGFYSSPARGLRKGNFIYDVFLWRMAYNLSFVDFLH